jgi:hypothetical protein
MKEIKTAIIDHRKENTPTEALKRMVSRVIEHHYGVRVYRGGLKRSKYSDLYDFVMFAVEGSKFHEYRGYVGTLGQVTVYYKDGEDLDFKEWESIF